MGLFATWWIWALLAIVFLILEIAAPGFIFLGFGAGATAVALLLAVGLLGSNFSVIVLVFALLSLASWFLMRRIFGVRKNQVKKWDIDINDDV